MTSQASNMFFGQNQAGAVGDVALSNPTPLNLVSITTYLVGDSIRYGAPRAALGYNGAGTAFVKSFSRTSLLQAAEKTGVTAGIGLLQAMKLGYDLGTYAGALVMCSK